MHYMLNIKKALMKRFRNRDRPDAEKLAYKPITLKHLHECSHNECGDIELKLRQFIEKYPII
jgi:hypothetical protein